VRELLLLSDVIEEGYNVNSVAVQDTLIRYKEEIAVKLDKKLQWLTSCRQKNIDEYEQDIKNLKIDPWSIAFSSCFCRLRL